MFSTAEGLLTQNDKVTADGFQEVFETNLFGHFILVKKKKGLGPTNSILLLWSLRREWTCDCVVKAP